MDKPCVKVCYPSRKIAKHELKRLNKLGLGLTDVYFCEAHQSWHHTSMEKTRARDYRRYLKNKKK